MSSLLFPLADYELLLLQSEEAELHNISIIKHVGTKVLLRLCADVL